MSDAIFSLTQGVDFEATADGIQCRADRIGATVREVLLGSTKVRVLAHDDASAEAAAIEWLRTRDASFNQQQQELENQP